MLNIYLGLLVGIVDVRSLIIFLHLNFIMIRAMAVPVRRILQLLLFLLPLIIRLWTAIFILLRSRDLLLTD